MKLAIHLTYLGLSLSRWSLGGNYFSPALLCSIVWRR